MAEELFGEGLLSRIEKGEAVGEAFRADIEWCDVRFFESRIVVGGYYRGRKGRPFDELKYYVNI
jgi:hypothetical protein